MTLSIELTPDDERQLKAEAARKGVAPEEYARALIRERLGQRTLPTDHSLSNLFAKWDEEDATTDPEEITRRQQEWEELKASMNAHHGSHRVLFP